jgi:inner membrane protein
MAVIRDHCDAAVFMRFARAPWIAQRDGRWIIGDLRYDREPELGFAELALDGTSRECMSRMPPWTAPRRDLLP